MKIAQCTWNVACDIAVKQEDACGREEESKGVTGVTRQTGDVEITLPSPGRK